jgi:PAS domain S-box-containing protein
MCSEGTIIQIHDFAVKYLPRVPIIAVAPSIDRQQIEHLLYTVGFSDYVRDDDYTRIYMSILKEMHNKKRRIEDQRKQDHQNISSLVSAYNDKGIIITDKFTRIEWVNSKITEICGYETEEIIGNFAGKLLQGPITDDETVNDIRRNLRKGIRFESELVNYHKDGWPYWVHIDITPLFYDGEVTRFVAIEEDISEKKPPILQLYSG